MWRIMLFLGIGGASMGGALVNLLAILSEAELVGLTGSILAAILGTFVMPSVYLLSRSPDDESRGSKKHYGPKYHKGRRTAGGSTQTAEYLSGKTSPSGN